MDKLMIIDSNETTLNYMYTMLCDSDFELYTATKGGEALIKINELMPDIIILHSDLSDMSGFDVCKTIKSNTQTKYVMVLLLLAVETNDYIRRALHSNADDYISIDLTSTILLAKLNSFLRMKHLNNTIHEQYLELKDKDDLINFQLKMAMKVQRSIIRDIDTKIGNMHIISKYLPALEIGGDFFDVKQLDDNHIGIILGDVSGHGISAALLTSMLNMMFSNLYHKFRRPNDLLLAMNSQFCDIFNGSDNQMYACIFYAIVDIANNKIIYSNAGQAFPVFVSEKEQKAVELELGGTPIGIIAGANYINEVIEYNENDLIFFHTDGLSDFLYKDNPEVFTNKLQELLVNSTINKISIDDTLSKILEAFYIFDSDKKYENDDVSMLLCRL